MNDEYYNVNLMDKENSKYILESIKEDSSESEASRDDESYQNFKPIVTEKPPKWICSKLYTYNNPCADEIANIIKEVSEKLINGPDETTPLLGYNKDNSKMSGYSSSYSSLNTYPPRQKYKFSHKNDFADESSSYSFESSKKSQDMNLFDKYDKVVRTEIRLINKVSSTQSFSGLT